MTKPGAKLQSQSNVTPISSAAELLIQLLKQATLFAQPMQDGVAGPNGVSNTELKIIIALGGEGALAGHDLSQISAIPPMNVSRALASLLGRGWIEPVTDPANRRRKPVQLSAAGWAAYREMTPDLARVADALFADLSPSDRTVLEKLTAKVIGRMEQWGASSKA